MIKFLTLPDQVVIKEALELGEDIRFELKGKVNIKSKIKNFYLHTRKWINSHHLVSLKEE